MLHIMTWRWGDKYGPDYTAKLRAGIARNMASPFAWQVCTPEPEDMHLTAIKGCFARLRMFDPAWQRKHGVQPGDRIVCMDLDAVVTGPLDALFAQPDPFAILQGANSSNPCPYNGSVWMLDAGYRPDVWTGFSLEAAALVPHYEFPDDQAWFAQRLPYARSWKVGPASGIYAFQKPGWPKGAELPADARLVVFPGWRDPVTFAHLPWVREHWRT